MITPIFPLKLNFYSWHSCEYFSNSTNVEVAKNYVTYYVFVVASATVGHNHVFKMIQIFDSPMLNSYIFLKDIIQDVLDSYKKIKSIDLYSIRVNTLNLSTILWKGKETVVNLCCKKLQDEVSAN